MQKCNWLNIDEIANYMSLISMWNLINRQVPLQTLEHIAINENNRLSTIHARLQTVASSLRWKTINSWNSLSDTLRCNTSLKSFKKQIKTWIIEQRAPG